MKILLATGIYPPEIGGPATYAFLVKQELETRGHHVHILPFRIVRKLPTIIRHIVYFFYVLWETTRADVVLAQDTVSVGFPSLIASYITNTPMVVRVPGDFAWEQGVQRFGVKEGIDDFQKMSYGFRVELLRSIQKWVVRHAQYVITPSDYFLRLVKGWGVHESRIQRIYNGVSVPKDIVPVSFPSTTIVSAGRLVPWKGFDTLIAAMAGIDANLVIIGEGDDRHRLETLAHETGVNERVSCVGALPREKLLSYIAGSQLCVLPSSFESFSFLLVEAMMVGGVVVALHTGNMDEIIKSGHNGMLIEKDHIKNMPSFLQGLLQDDSLRQRLSREAMVDSQKFNIETTVNQLESVLKNIL